MKNNNSLIVAFSIVEAIVAMVISAIVMGLTFSIFSIITDRMIDFKNQNQLVNDMNRLTFSINKDIFDSESLNYSDDELTFNGYTGDHTKYYFQEKQILRYKEEFIDTFKINVRQIHIDSVKSKSERLVFQKIKMTIEVNQQPINLNFYKKIYANQLLAKFNQK